MAVLTGRVPAPTYLYPYPPQRRTTSPAALGVAGVAVAMGAVLGLAAGLGLSLSLLLALVVGPFFLLLTFARPHWGVGVYVVLVYADLLSIFVKYQGMPPLARFAGVVLLGAVLGYRLIVRRQGLANDVLTWWLVAYGALVALGLGYARSPDLVMTNVTEFVRNFLAYLIIVNALTTFGRLERTVIGVFAMGVALASLTLYQSLTGQFDSDFGGLAQYRASEIVGGEDAPRPGGTLGDANYYGQSLLILVPIGLYLFFEARSLLARWAGLAGAGILVAATVFTYSRGDAVALGVVFLAAVAYKRPKPSRLIAGIIALAIVLPLLPGNYFARLATILDVVGGNRQTILLEDSIRGRAGATQAAIEMFKDHALVGVGRENYPLYELDYLEGTPLAKYAKGIPPHNLYLEIAAEHGILGLLVVGGLLLAVWRAIVEARRRFVALGSRREAELVSWLAIALLGYLASAMFLHGAFLHILWLQVALLIALRQIARALEPAAVLPLGSGLEIAIPTREASGSTRSSERELREMWLGAAEMARLRGDLKVARALVDLVLERDPYNGPAWGMSLRLRLHEIAQPSRVAETSPIEDAGVGEPSVEEPIDERGTTLTPAIFSETGYAIDERFLALWEEYGGVPVFGLPISPLMVEEWEEEGNVEAQYFERARFEWHIQEDGTGAVALGGLGLEVPLTGVQALPLPAGLQGEAVVFRVEGMAIEIPRPFFTFWERNDGLTLFGYPLTPVLWEERADGSPVAVQYFERARFEYHPEPGGGGGEVRLADLGAEVYWGRYGSE